MSRSHPKFRHLRTKARMQTSTACKVLTTFLTISVLQVSAPPTVCAQQAISLQPISERPVDSTVPGTALPRYEGLIPTDITNMPNTELPTPPGSRASFFSPWPPDWAYKLPSNLWLNTVVEAAQRYDTNVFQTRSGYVSDYSFRVHPRVQVGWRMSNLFQPYTEYFLFKDVHTRAYNFNQPTSQSVAGGAKGALWTAYNPDDKGLKKTLAYDFRARVWWFNSHQRQYDLIPSLIWEQVLNYKSKTNHTKYELRALLQLDERKTRTGTTREIDPFFNARLVHARGKWLFSPGVTLALDFPTYTGDKPRLKTGAVIGNLEVSRKLPVPNLYWYVQGQPIWNFSDKSVPGYSGFNFRLFSGVRMVFDRPPVTQSVRAAWQKLRH